MLLSHSAAFAICGGGSGCSGKEALHGARGGSACLQTLLDPPGPGQLYYRMDVRHKASHFRIDKNVNGDPCADTSLG
jgi:hypothetical protein